MKRKLLPILFVSTLYLLAQTPVDEGHRLEKRPVDEGHKLVHHEDKTKGAEDVNNSHEYQGKSLKEMKSTFTIRRKDISHAPFTLLHYNAKEGNITTLKVEEMSINSVNFSVKKSMLEVGDRVLVINNRKSKNEHAPKGKEVIIEIEILK